LNYLALQERAVGDIVLGLKMDQPSVSKHLRVLRNVGLVRMRRNGRGAVDNAANLARCKSLRRQLPVFGRLVYPVRAEATKHVLPGRKSLGRPTA
jgi:DNA-binding transcriptional ArsR family regulator